MTRDKARKHAARQFAADNSTSYTRAARLTAATIDPVFLAPYPDEMVRPKDAGDEWQPVTAAELGWRALPPNATPAQRARAESVWRPVATDRLCRCSGPCHHGQPCGNGDDGILTCTGRLIHHDRLAASLLDVYGWYDTYGCDGCSEEFEVSVDLPDVPWGERVGNSITQFDGVRRITFYGTDDDGGEVPHQYCPECGADYHYQCACYDEYADA
jgi:hypothetical protein